MIFSVTSYRTQNYKIYHINLLFFFFFEKQKLYNLGYGSLTLIEIEEIKERCEPQCTLNQEPGYVIYSAVGSFYAPMLVMMFFNWRIYQTAKKTTKAIRQGWTRVKGVSGEEVIGLGIHRGGGAFVSSASASAINHPPSHRSTNNQKSTTNGSSRSSGATVGGVGVHQLTSTDSRQCSTRLVGNGLAPRDLDKVGGSGGSATIANRYLPNLML